LIGRRPWRVGTSVGRTIYDADDNLIGVMDTPLLAAEVVEGVNLVAGLGRRTLEAGLRVKEALAPEKPATGLLEPVQDWQSRRGRQCTACGGTGEAAGGGSCPACRGTGWVPGP
jgi:hypothetical protein